METSGLALLFFTAGASPIFTASASLIFTASASLIPTASASLIFTASTFLFFTAGAFLILTASAPLFWGLEYIFDATRIDVKASAADSPAFIIFVGDRNMIRIIIFVAASMSSPAERVELASSVYTSTGTYRIMTLLAPTRVVCLLAS